MKHRSIVTFIVLVAALAVAPQVAHEFEQLAANAASRVEGAMWNVFLSVNAQKLTGDDSRPDSLVLVEASQPQPGNVAARGKATSSSTRANVASARGAANHQRMRAEDSASSLLAKNGFKPFVLDFHTGVNPQVNLSLPAPEAKVATLRRREEGRELLRVVASLKDDETREEMLSRLEQLVERRVRQGGVRFELRHKAGEEWVVEPPNGRNAPALPFKVQKAKAQVKGACPTPAPEASLPSALIYQGAALGVSDSF